jgi:nitrate reductase gamma subunit
MSDWMLFTVAPYAAALGFLMVSIFRLVVVEPPPINGDRAPSREHLRMRAVVGVCALALVAGHLLLVLAPDAVLRWNRHASRLLLLEASIFGSGVICSIAVIARLWRHLFERTRDADRSVADTVMLTLVAIEVVSGVALAVGYRWASSWSVVTLTPYAVSLVRFAPRLELVGATPFVVRLHVFCTFAIVALLPFTLVGSRALIAIKRAVDGVATPLSRAFGPVRARIEYPVVRILRSRAIWGEEEN